MIVGRIADILERSDSVQLALEEIKDDDNYLISSDTKRKIIVIFARPERVICHVMKHTLDVERALSQLPPSEAKGRFQYVTGKTTVSHFISWGDGGKQNLQFALLEKKLCNDVVCRFILFGKNREFMREYLVKTKNDDLHDTIGY